MSKYKEVNDDIFDLVDTDGFITNRLSINGKIIPIKVSLPKYLENTKKGEFNNMFPQKYGTTRATYYSIAAIPAERTQKDMYSKYLPDDEGNIVKVKPEPKVNYNRRKNEYIKKCLNNFDTSKNIYFFTGTSHQCIQDTKLFNRLRNTWLQKLVRWFAKEDGITIEKARDNLKVAGALEVQFRGALHSHNIITYDDRKLTNKERKFFETAWCDVFNTWWEHQTIEQRKQFFDENGWTENIPKKIRGLFKRDGKTALDVDFHTTQALMLTAKRVRKEYSEEEQEIFAKHKEKWSSDGYFLTLYTSKYNSKLIEMKDSGDGEVIKYQTKALSPRNRIFSFTRSCENYQKKQKAISYQQLEIIVDRSDESAEFKKQYHNIRTKFEQMNEEQHNLGNDAIVSEANEVLTKVDDKRKQGLIEICSKRKEMVRMLYKLTNIIHPNAYRVILVGINLDGVNKNEAFFYPTGIRYIENTVLSKEEAEIVFKTQCRNDFETK